MTDTPDLENRAAPQDHHALRLWLRMLTCCNLIESEICSRLRTEFDTTLPRFDLMAQLQRSPKGMRMGELSRHMMVTNGNITGITDQLEKEGLVVRTKVESDRRSSVLKLTPQGRKSFARMVVGMIPVSLPGGNFYVTLVLSMVCLATLLTWAATLARSRDTRL